MNSLIFLFIFNYKKGCKYIKKRNLQTLKDVTELYFSVILGFYTKQLRNYTDTQLKLNLPTTIKKNGLKQVEIDHRKLATHKIKDVVRLEGCKRTLQNHVKRLREAGLLTHYVYSNQFNAIKVSINNKILVVLDGKLPKTQNTQNQIVKEMESKELHNNSDTIRTNLKEKEKKGDVFNIGSIISGSMLQSMKTMSADSYKNTEEKQTEKIKDQLAQKFNVNSKISFNARKIIIDNDKNFAEDLANKVYDKYTVLRYDRLLKLIQYSDLSANEIKKLLTQDIIKQSAKIWKDHNVYVGEWKKTINVLTGNLFKNMVQKETMLQKHREYRWKINFARQLFLKNKQIKALFTYKYFDSTRKTTKEVGFYGLHYAWKSHINYSIKKSQQIKQQKLDAETRKRKISSDKKFQNILQKYFTGKIDFIKMYDYIKNNIPEYMKKLEEKFKNYNQLTA